MNGSNAIMHLVTRYKDLSESEQKQIFTDVAWEIKRIGDANAEWLGESNRLSNISMQRFARGMCNFDHHETFMSYSDERKLIAVKQFQKGESVDAFFVLNNICQVDEIVMMSLDIESNFNNFERLATRGFSKTNLDLGSSEFLKTLHQYFLKYASWQENKEGLLRQSRTYDPYLMHAALLLLRVYDEQRIIAVLKHIINDSHISAEQFIHVVKSTLSIAEIHSYPLTWTINVIDS